MIRFIKGKIVDKLPGKVVIENSGIGFLVNVSDSSPAYYAKEDEDFILYTVMTVREDDISLFGFANLDEMNMYQMLTSVSGIGSKGAMSILSKLSVDEIKKACVFEDADTIATSNGIGKKTAERIVLELKDKFNVSKLNNTVTSAEESQIVKGTSKEEALGALMNLGFTKSEAVSALTGINDAGLTTEELIKAALRNKGK